MEAEYSVNRQTLLHTFSNAKLLNYYNICAELKLFTGIINFNSGASNSEVES